MLHFNKIFNLVKTGTALVVISMLFSCTPYRYFNPRVEFYSFDTCKEARVIVEPYIWGYDIGGAYSLTNHLAVSANYQWNYATTGDGPLPYDGALGSSYGKAGNFGFGYFNKFSKNKGIDLFAQYEYETVRGYNYSDYVPGNSISYDTINYKYHSFSLLCSYYYHTSDKHFGIAIGCRGTALVDNYFTSDTTLTKVIVTRHYKLGNFILTPGFNLNYKDGISIAQFGFYYNWASSLGNPFKTTFFWPFEVNVKLVIPISFGSNHNKKTKPPHNVLF